MKHLILNADDFAFNAAASRGIVTLAQQGRLTATSAMTLSPRWVKDAPALAEARHQIDVGLHLDWTSPFAMQAGHGRSLTAAMLTAVLGGFSQVEARTVIERQLDAFEQVWKEPPSHIDGHQHVQQFKGIREALVDVMLKRYSHLSGQERPYLRVSQDPSGQTGFKSKVIASLGANAIKNIAAQAVIMRSKGLFGIYSFDKKINYSERMQQWLSLAAEGSIIMCHPAHGISDAGDVPDDIAAARQWEFDYLASESFLNDLWQAKVSLVPL